MQILNGYKFEEKSNHIADETSLTKIWNYRFVRSAFAQFTHLPNLFSIFCEKFKILQMEQTDKLIQLWALLLQILCDKHFWKHFSLFVCAQCVDKRALWFCCFQVCQRAVVPADFYPLEKQFVCILFKLRGFTYIVQIFLLCGDKNCLSAE